MNAAILERQRAERPAAASKVKSPAAGALTFEFRDHLINGLHTTGAAAQMLKAAFAGELLEEPAKADGLMGTLQFLNRTLAALRDELLETSRPIDDLYWGLHFASSMAALLEELQWGDAFRWSMSPQFLYDCLSAVSDNIDKAAEAAEASR